MGKKKTNVDFLRDILDKNLKEYDESAYVEAIEFLDAIQEDIDDLNSEITSHKDEVLAKDEDIRELNSQISEFETREGVCNVINAGIGEIKWDADNLQLIGLMETLGDKIKQHTPLKILNLLTVI